MSGLGQKQQRTSFTSQSRITNLYEFGGSLGQIIKTIPTTEIENESLRGAEPQGSALAFFTVMIPAIMYGFAISLKPDVYLAPTSMDFQAPTKT
jgi:hypothetical protein